MKAFKRYFLSIFLILLGWKLVAMAVSSSVLPSPEAAFAAFGQAVKTLAFWGHFGLSVFRAAAAMAAAWLVAFPLGLLIGYHRRADELLSPSIFLTYPIPKIVLLPVVLMLFGLGEVSRIFMIALIVGYQILVATRDSVLGLDRKYIDSFRSLGGRDRQIMRHVIVPAALPQAFTALRIGAGTAIAVLFFVETFATDRGLGFLILDAWGRADARGMFAGIIGLSLLGVLLYETINYLDRNLCAWKYLAAGHEGHERRAPGAAAYIMVFGRMIKFSHTVFAMPFALAALVLAQREHILTLALVFWIVAAMVGARSAAMGFNRIADARLDALNPRTAGRAIPAGVLSVRAAYLFVLFFSAVFVLAAAMISRLCLVLSFPVLAVLFVYSYTKRFTSFSHLYLGFCISLAPVGAWLAVTGGFDWRVLTVSAALLTYIAGFDILYACQDLESDQETGLFSFPARFGLNAALHFSALLHLLSFGAFVSIYFVFDQGVVYLSALFVIGFLLVLEHKLVSPHDLGRLQVAFFHVNSAVSLVLFLGVLGDELVRRLA
ncbi:MAG: UbiA-like polyprenyltransferase [Thermodesulfobacteriota bacterium]